MNTAICDKPYDPSPAERQDPVPRAWDGAMGLGWVLLMAIGVPAVAAEPTPHRWGALQRSADRGISLQLEGNVPGSYQNYFDLYPLEVSENLVDWVPLVTLVKTNLAPQNLLYLDTGARDLERRFYRTPTNHFVTSLAPPSGPYGVGRTVRIVTDPSRTNRYQSRPGSSFMMTVWYPSVRRAGDRPAPYIDAPLAIPLAVSHLESPGDNAQRLSGFVAYSVTEAPVASADRPFPVVIYSHGYTFHRQENSEKFEELVSHGFVVVAMDHIDARVSVFPDGTVVPGEFTDPPTPGLIVSLVASRLKDDQAAVRKLSEMNQGDPLLAGRLDLSRLGAMGWSLGASDLGQLAQADERFKGMVVLEGYYQGADALLDTLLQRGLRLPVLAMYEENADVVALFRQAASVATQDAFFGKVHLGSHFAFKDPTELVLARDAIREGTAALRGCMLSFFRKHLQGQDDRLLEDPTKSYPVIFDFVRR